MREPSLVEDLGTVGAASMRRDPVAWILGCALLVSTAWWAPAPSAVGWCVVVAFLAVPVPLLPRVLLRGAGAAALVLVAGAAIGLAPVEDRRNEAALDVLLGIGEALAIPWAAGVAWARRARPTAADAEAASARLAIWAQEHPWRVALAVLPLVGPCGALWMQAWIATDAAHSGNIPAHLMVPQWVSPGALVLVAATFGRRLLRATEAGVVGLAVAGVVWAALAWIGNASAGSGAFLLEVVWFLLGLGGVSLLFLVVAAWTARFPPGGTIRLPYAAVAVVSWLFVEALLASIVAHRVDRGPPPNTPADWVVLVLRHGVLLAVLLAAMASTLRGRTIVLLLMLYGAAVTLLAEASTGRPIWGPRCAPVAALGCLNQALFVLAARRIRSMTVVPADHPLRTDWAVDLGARASPAAADA